MQNGLGLVLAGGLAGFVGIQNQKKNALQEDLGGKISAEQKTVNELRKKVKTSGLKHSINTYLLQEFLIDFVVNDQFLYRHMQHQL